jgi:hypothetical protein
MRIAERSTAEHGHLARTTAAIGGTDMERCTWCVQRRASTVRSSSDAAVAIQPVLPEAAPRTPRAAAYVSVRLFVR